MCLRVTGITGTEEEDDALCEIEEAPIVAASSASIHRICVQLLEMFEEEERNAQQAEAPPTPPPAPPEQEEPPDLSLEIVALFREALRDT